MTQCIQHPQEGELENNPSREQPSYRPTEVRQNSAEATSLLLTSDRLQAKIGESITEVLDERIAVVNSLPAGTLGLTFQ
jgi:hypothetical protein